MVHRGVRKQFGKLYDVVLDILYRADLARVHSPDPTECKQPHGEIREFLSN